MANQSPSLCGREFSVWVLLLVAVVYSVLMTMTAADYVRKTDKLQVEVYDLKVKHENWYWLIKDRVALPRPEPAI